MAEIEPLRPIPAALYGREAGTWQHYTITERLPGIARRVLAENELEPEQSAAIDQLIAEMPGGPIRPLASGASAPDAADWPAYVVPFIGDSWLEVPWFFAEMYFFRRILEATGYFGPGRGEGMDPYRHQKEEGLAAAASALEVMLPITLRGSGPDTLAELLTYDLWGNQADLSIWPAQRDENGQLQGDNGPGRAHLLINQIPAAVAYLEEARYMRPVRVDYLVDNAGTELVSDLLAVEYLLRHDVAVSVVVHAKPYPTFVSDAIIPDVVQTIEWLASQHDTNTGPVGRRLRRYLSDGRLRLTTHTYWTSPMPFWEMPFDLQAVLGQSDLIVVKGDMNYRRLHGDRHWPFDTPFEAVVNGAPAPLLALRVLKAEVATGLSPEQVNALSAEDPDWMTNGKWGMAPFYLGADEGP